MKETFQQTNEELDVMGVSILKISNDFYLQPLRRGKHYFLKSPINSDRVWSLCLYENSNSFYDFSTNHSGDRVGFISYIKGINNWESMKLLRDYYGLPDSKEKDVQETRRKILAQQVRERSKKDRQQAFHKALNGTIDILQRWADMYRNAIEKFEPFSDIWTQCMNELQLTEHRLDILCGSDQNAYRFMKTGSEYISSDKPQWLLDVLSILEEEQMFFATKNERETIRKALAQEMRKRVVC